jgi:iron complex transport system substrate-binding protein
MTTILNKAMVPLIASALVLTACSSPAAGAPSPTASATRIDSCGLPLDVTTPPTRAITMDQGATEMLLALGLHDRMIGTAYRTDVIGTEFQKDYATVPVLSEQYPTTEQVREQNPDLVYSMRSSAFGPDAAGSRKDLVDLGVPAYLSSNDCEDQSLIAPAGFEQIGHEITDLATIFDVPERGAALVAKQQHVLDDVAKATPLPKQPSIVWLYSTINGSPIVAGSTGLANVMTTLAGGTNAFSDLRSQWTEVSWDDIAQRDPDVLVIADSTRGIAGDSASDKLAFLTSDAVTSHMRAVVDHRIIALPATELDPSVRSIQALRQLSKSVHDFAGPAA